jgi:hypothetical protein
MTSHALPEVYCDEDVPEEVGQLLAQWGHVIHWPHEIQLKGQSDASILGGILGDDWIIITQNRRDFQRLHALWATLYTWDVLNRKHNGILTIYEQEQREPRRWAEAIHEFLQVHADLAGKFYLWRNSSGLWEEGPVALR